MSRDLRTRAFRPRPAAALLIAGILAAVTLPGAADDTMPMDHGGMTMTDAEMLSMSNAWYAEHPPVGIASTAAAVETVLVSNFLFDSDGNASTAFDTTTINVGDTVLWLRVSGTHTTTSGTGASDPESGLLWDQPINVSATSFARQFSDPGTFPFYCKFHASLMKGVIQVTAPSGVAPVDGNSDRAGFLTGPTPNPTQAASEFRFAITAPGRTRIEIFDVNGRSVATTLDRYLDAGSWQGSWDGRTALGESAPAGVYYVMLAGPGVRETRRVVLTR